MAVALVIFARWEPMRCLWASLLFGRRRLARPGAARPELDVRFGRIPLEFGPLRADAGIMMLTSSRSRALAGAPGVLTASR